jgi:hypothetical protein
MRYLITPGNLMFRAYIIFTERKNFNENLTIADFFPSYPYVRSGNLEVAFKSFIVKSVSIFTFKHLHLIRIF